MLPYLVQQVRTLFSGLAVACESDNRQQTILDTLEIHRGREAVSWESLAAKLAQMDLSSPLR